MTTTTILIIILVLSVIWKRKEKKRHPAKVIISELVGRSISIAIVTPILLFLFTGDFAYSYFQFFGIILIAPIWIFVIIKFIFSIKKLHQLNNTEGSLEDINIHNEILWNLIIIGISLSAAHSIINLMEMTNKGAFLHQSFLLTLPSIFPASKLAAYLLIFRNRKIGIHLLSTTLAIEAIITSINFQYPSLPYLYFYYLLLTTALPITIILMARKTVEELPLTETNRSSSGPKQT